MFIALLRLVLAVCAAFALVLEPVALARDLHNVGVMKERIKHRRRIVWSSAKAPAHCVNRKVARQHDAGSFVRSATTLKNSVSSSRPNGS